MRPDCGTGFIIKISEGKADVKFKNTAFSGIPLSAVSLVKPEIKSESKCLRQRKPKTSIKEHYPPNHNRIPSPSDKHRLGKAESLKKCTRCDGEGDIPIFAHYFNGVCFKCGGTGWLK